MILQYTCIFCQFLVSEKIPQIKKYNSTFPLKLCLRPAISLKYLFNFYNIHFDIVAHAGHQRIGWFILDIVFKLQNTRLFVCSLNIFPEYDAVKTLLKKTLKKWWLHRRRFLRFMRRCGGCRNAMASDISIAVSKCFVRYAEKCRNGDK